MKKKIFWGFTFLFCLLSGTVAAEELLKSEYSYRRYTTQDGLPDLVTAAVFQDSRGYIWVGTYSRFVRYDGYGFKNFESYGSSILGFYEDKNGNVNALSLIARFTVDSKTDSVHRQDLIKSTDMYRFRNTMSLPEGYAMYRIDNKSAIYQYVDTGIVKVWEHDLLNEITEGLKPYWDRENKHFFIPTEQGLYVVAEDGTLSKTFNVKTINSFLPYCGKLWAVADDGLYVYDHDEKDIKRVIEYPFFDKKNKDYSICIDKDNNLLVRTTSNLFRYVNGKIETVSSEVSLLLDICRDTEGNIWLADASGLFNYYTLNIKNYALPDKSMDAGSIIADNRNNIWLAISSGNLIRINRDGKQERIKYPAETEYDHFNEFSTVNGDDIYFTNVGILHYNSRTNRFRRLALPEISYAYTAILPDDCLFVGDLYSAYVYDLKTDKIKREFSIKDFNQRIVTAISDKKGKIILCGANGLSIFENDTIRKFYDERLLYSRNPFFDAQGKLWLTCQDRLVTVENDSITVRHTFPQNIRSFYVTRKGYVVAATINDLWLSKSLDNLDFVKYDRNNGFNALDVVETPLAEDSEGNVWLSVSGNVVCFNPQKMFDNQLKPKLILQSLRTSNDNIHWEKAEWNPASFNYSQNNLSFSFIGINFSAAENVRYRYRLLGFQNEFSEPTKQREVTFNNLKPGDYTFEIYADAGTDESKSEIQTVSFSIHPAFWQTTWFIVAAILALMLASAGIALFYQRRKNKVLFERLETEKQLNDLRIRSIRLKAIPHFNANVLAAIEYYIMNMSKTEALRLLGIYSRFTFQTLREVDKASRSLNEELEYVKMYLEL
jgi:ligand-binding sensor domain-containing protein